MHIELPIYSLCVLEYVVSLLQTMTPLVSKIRTFFNFIKSGGNASQFAVYQAESLAIAFKEQDDATKAASDAADKFASDQYFAAAATKTLTKELLAKNKAEKAGEGGTRSAVKPITTTLADDMPKLLDATYSGLGADFWERVWKADTGGRDDSVCPKPRVQKTWHRLLRGTFRRSGKTHQPAVQRKV